ncbi:tubulin-folding cofactor e [Quercus suber]|uniref:Tubulin-folding cofactor e n=1 Tax=Quercus suber TaxID=58331 RepID=A0AAW0LQ00_QUESU
MQDDSAESSPEFRVGQRVHSANDPRRIGTVKYVGPIEGHAGEWVGVDWDTGEAKHDGSVNGIRYFQAGSDRSGSFVRAKVISPGISVVRALELRYRTDSTKEEEDEMYVFSASNKRVSVQLVGKDKIQDKLSRFEELTGASLSYLGVSTPGDPGQIGTAVPNLKELDLTGNLLSEWKDVCTICEQLPALAALNLSNNLMSSDICGLAQLKSIRILVLNDTGIKWTQIEKLKHSLPAIEELHLMGNNISTIEPTSSSVVQGFDSLRLLNLEDNCIAEWDEILKLSQIRGLEQLHLNKNNLNRIYYPPNTRIHEFLGGNESQKERKLFTSLRCLLLGGNNIEDLASVDALNSFPKLVVSPRERKDSEIRYVRLIMSKLHDPQEIKQVHPRFAELKNFHGIEDERPSIGVASLQKMASGLLSITLKCVGATMGEKPPLTKKLPATTTVGKLKSLSESFFKLKSIKPKLFLQEEGSPLPILLDDEMESLMDLGIGNGSTILIDEES